ncbi:hypothetical protein O1D97_07860 [Marinomonas sp. 15G1-11]|uniref:Uncharacterized protein n=1 Tax=Marinomonas phaeophyticola TaxID=3004091 RepID=A0ABT4JT65_9GAMM|nr:hypothetical protein [Marinomonas sp. 15G1-11]MCZ2721569.1 hypothetical protein [Marinomonas sp. 15G1-11]
MSRIYKKYHSINSISVSNIAFGGGGGGGGGGSSSREYSATPVSSFYSDIDSDCLWGERVL